MGIASCAMAHLKHIRELRRGHHRDGAVPHSVVVLKTRWTSSVSSTCQSFTAEHRLRHQVLRLPQARENEGDEQAVSGVHFWRFGPEIHRGDSVPPHLRGPLVSSHHVPCPVRKDVRGICHGCRARWIDVYDRCAKHCQGFGYAQLSIRIFNILLVFLRHWHSSVPGVHPLQWQAEKSSGGPQVSHQVRVFVHSLQCAILLLGACRADSPNRVCFDQLLCVEFANDAGSLRTGRVRIFPRTAVLRGALPSLLHKHDRLDGLHREYGIHHRRAC